MTILGPLNTLGTVAGAFAAAGLFLIPRIGVQRVMVVGAALNVAVGGALTLARS